MDNTQQRPIQQPTQHVALPVTDMPSEDIVKKPEEQPQISGPNKELGPMSASPSESGGQSESDDEDEIKVARQEVMLGQKVTPAKEVPISKELQEAGVEQGSDTEQEIPVVVQRAGMRATSADSAIPVSATASIKLPISYAHAKELDKHAKIKESIKWLARFIKRQWERVQFVEKHKEQKLEEL